MFRLRKEGAVRQKLNLTLGSAEVWAFYDGGGRGVAGAPLLEARPASDAEGSGSTFPRVLEH